MKEIHRQNEKHKHNFVDVTSGGDWNKWCPECGALKFWKPSGRHKYKYSKTKQRTCKRKHQWLEAYQIKEGYGPGSWDRDVQWCKQCGSLKHQGCHFQHMAGFQYVQKSQVVETGELIENWAVFNGEGLFSRKE